MRLWKSAFLIALLSAVPHVAQGQRQVQALSPAPAAAPAAGANDDYALGVADKIRLIVFNEDNLSGEFVVTSNGFLSLPLIGEVPAKGRTLGAVRDDIKSRLASGYLLNPQVSVEVLSFRPYYILGEVTKPGEYPYSSGLTVPNAVATAEGFTYRANKRKVFIKHAGQPNEESVPMRSDLPVEPGDTIRVGERYF